jgi:5-methylcytosine-specific restriction protein A
MCLAMGAVTASAVVDHKTPHKGDPALMWDEANWQALCKPCHDRDKQAIE